MNDNVENKPLPSEDTSADECDLHINDDDAAITVSSYSAPFPNIYIYDDKYGQEVETPLGSSYFQPYGQEVSIRAHYRDILTGEEFFELIYRSGDLVKTQMFSRDVVANGNIGVLSKAGVDISIFSKSVFCKLMANQFETAKRQWVHHWLGWHTFTADKGQKSLGYFCNRLISDLPELKSKYNGYLKLKSNADRKEWLRMVKKHVLGHTELEFALVLGVSASLTGYLKNYANVGSLFVNLVGKTSTGKTTAANLAINTASIIGKGRGHLTISWHATKNGIIGFLADNNGVPVVLDEMSEAPFTNLSDLIFQIADGSDKQRANTDGSAKAASAWATTVLSTSNVSVYDLCNDHNEALQTRILEFTDVNWTSSAEQADEINRVVKTNGGFLIRIFSKKLLNHDPLDLVRRMEEIRSAFPALPESNGTGKIIRVDEKLALLLLAAEILRDEVNLKVDVDKLKGFLMEHRLKSLKDCLSEEDAAYLYLLDVIHAEPGHFYSDNSEFFPHEVWGVYRPNSKKLEINFIPLRFQEIMARGGYREYRRILRRWKERGLLNCDPDRLTRTRSMYKVYSSTLVYAVRIVHSYSLHLVHDEATAQEYGCNPLPLNEPKFFNPNK